MLTVVTSCTSTPRYVEGAERLQRQCEEFGLAFRRYDLHPPEDVENLRMWAAGQKPLVCLQAFKDGIDELLYIDADDEIVGIPGEFPECAIGLWRNYELDLFPTHLIWCSNVYAKRCKFAEAFILLWSRLSWSLKNEHRTLHNVWTIYYNCFADPQPIKDVTASVSGCIKGNPSPLGYRKEAVVVH